MRLILLSCIIAVVTFAASSPQDRERISLLESKLLTLQFNNLIQQDTNQSQSILNSNQITISNELIEQIKALKLRLNKLEKRKQ